MITIKNLSKKFKTKHGEFWIFKDINLTIKAGESIALIGKNGAGKSTFLKLLAGIDYPDRGGVYTKKSISWPIGSKDALHPLLTARENVTFVSIAFIGKNKRKLEEKVSFVEKFADIEKSFDKPFKTLSAGMKTRVSFGLSMAFDFDFYLIDELSAAGDQFFRKKSRDYLKEKLKKGCFIMVDHNLNNLQVNCNKAFLINENKIIQYSNVEEAIKVHKDLLMRS